MYRDFRRGPYCISTNPNQLDVDVIHQFLRTSYWSPGILRSVVVTAIENSLCFGLFDNKAQIGFARVVTDYTNHAYLCDVFVLENYRGQGLGKWLVETVVTYPELQNIRRMMLITDDAHQLYQPLGFEPLAEPHKFMAKLYHRHWHKEPSQ